MQFDAKTGRFSVEARDLASAAHQFKYALRNIRLAAGLPLHPYKQSGLGPVDHAQIWICENQRICQT